MKLSLVPFFVSTAFLLGCSMSFEEPYNMAAISNIYVHNGVKIHFRELGGGKPIIFIHGFGASLDSWRFIEEAFKTEFRLVLIDLKGHGYSDRPYDSQYSIQDHARIVIGLIRHLGLSEAVVVGHSLGSAVALAAALEAKKNSLDVVTSLVLIAGSADLDNLPAFIRILRKPLIGWLLMKLTSPSFRTRTILKKAYYDDRKITDDVVAMYARYQRMPGADYALLKTAEQIVPSDFSNLKQELAKLDIPVVNIWGEHDEIVKRTSAEGLCRLLPRCKLVVVEEVGHVPQEETPEKILPLLKISISGS